MRISRPIVLGVQVAVGVAALAALGKAMKEKSFSVKGFGQDVLDQLSDSGTFSGKVVRALPRGDKLQDFAKSMRKKAKKAAKAAAKNAGKVAA